MKKINLIFFLILSACSDNQKALRVTNVDLSEQELKLSLPKTLWEKITNRYEDNKKFRENKYDFFHGIPMVISITDQKKSVLKEPFYKISMGSFGGQIDLAEYVREKEKGELQLYFTPDLNEEDMKHLKVYYVSNSKKRKLFNETVGNGCNTLLNLTDYFSKELFKKYLSLHTGQLRYASTVSGKYYFVLQESERLRISQITFLDSRYPELTCEEKI